MFFLITLIAILALVALALIIALNKQLSTVAFQLDTARNDLHLLMYWYYPFFMAKVEMQDYSPLLDVYLFKKHVFSKVLRHKAGKKQHPFHLLRALDYSDAYAVVHYGLDNPFHTFVASEIVEMMSSAFEEISILQYPNFTSDREYVAIQAGAKLNIGKTLNHLAGF
jgi:hypothetical protein